MVLFCGREKVFVAGGKVCTCAVLKDWDVACGCDCECGNVRDDDVCQFGNGIVGSGAISLFVWRAASSRSSSSTRQYRLLRQSLSLSVLSCAWQRWPASK